MGVLRGDVTCFSRTGLNEKESLVWLSNGLFWLHKTTQHWTRLNYVNLFSCSSDRVMIFPQFYCAKVHKDQEEHKINIRKDLTHLSVFARWFIAPCAVVGVKVGRVEWFLQEYTGTVRQNSAKLCGSPGAGSNMRVASDILLPVWYDLEWWSCPSESHDLMTENPAE